MIFNENGVIIDSFKEINISINEINYIISDITNEYLNEAISFKEFTIKFKQRIKKIFDWIRGKLNDIKNWIIKRIDPIRNKIKKNKEKIVQKFNKLSKEEKEKLFNGNSANESCIIYESYQAFNPDCLPSQILMRFQSAIHESENVIGQIIYPAQKFSKDQYESMINKIKKTYIHEYNNDFNESVKNHFTNFENMFDNAPIDKIIDIALNGHDYVDNMKKNADRAEKLFKRYLDFSDGQLESEKYEYLKNIFNLFNIYTPHSISYINKIINKSTKICILVDAIKDKVKTTSSMNINELDDWD